MGDFLEYGRTSKGGADLAPVVIDQDPRGKSSDGFLEVLRLEREAKEAEEAYWENMAKENDFSKINYFGKSLVNESMSANLFGMAQDYFAEFDPAFDPTPYIDDTWPDWRKDAVADAKNDKHAEQLVKRTEEQDLYQKEGEYHGGVGTALNIAAAIANPENLLLGAGEISALTKLGLAGGKRVLAGATIGALSNSAQEAIIVANNKSREDLGIGMAAAFGGAFGGLASLVPTKALDEMRKLDEGLGKGLSNTWKRDLDIATGDIRINRDFYKSPDAQAWDDALEAGTGAVDVDGKYTITYGEGENMTTFQYDTKAQAVAAHRLTSKNIEPTPKAIAEQVDLDYEARIKKFDEEIKPRKWGGKYSSIGAEGLASKNPVTRWLHSLVVEDASGTGGKSVATHSAALRADQYAMQMRSVWHTSRHKYGKEWARETQPKNWKPWDNSAMDRFDDAVIEEVNYRRYASNRPKGQKPHKAVAAAADDYMKLQDMRFKQMKESGVAGYDTFETDSLYVKHKWDGVSMSQLQKKHSKQFIVDLLAQGILRGKEFERMSKYGHMGERLNEAFKERTARNMADAIFSRYTRRPDTVNMARAGWLTKKETKELERRAKELISNESDLKHLLSAAEGKDARLIDELASRIDLDLNATMDGVSIRDLMDTNLGASMDTEIRRSAGKTAMAKMGFESQEKFLEATEDAGRWYRENTDMTARDLEIENTKNQNLWKIVMGENLESNANSTIARHARLVRRMSTLASLNQVGFAQLAETGRLAGSIGVKNMIKQIPEFGGMIRKMKNGTFKDPILNDIEAAFGVRLGDNEILNHPMLLADAGGVGITKQDAKGWMAAIDTVSNKGLHVQGYLNGMNYLMKIQHRMHARGYFMRMFDDLKKGPSQARLNRYADMGFSEADLAAIKKNMDKHVEMGEGWFGQQRPINFNISKFDPEIRNKMALAYHKNQANAIQRNLGGETAWWMEGTAGKLFTQFRTFPLVAIEKQTLHDAKLLASSKGLDIEAYTTAVAGLGFAALAYTAKTYGNSFGLPAKKRKQYLKNRLTPEKIFAGASAWSGQANIMPDLMRSAGDFGFSNPWCYTAQKGQGYRDYYRQTGLDLGAVGAVGSMADSAYRAVTGLANVPLGEADLRKDVFKNVVRIAPFGNNLAVKIGANYALE